MKCVRELNRFLPEVYRRGGLGRPDVLYVMSNVREVLEHHRKYGQRYPILRLFCDWCVHKELDRQKVIYGMLVQASELLANSISPGKRDPKEATKLLIRRGGSLLNIPEFRFSLREVFAEQRIDNRIPNEKKWWDAFVSQLLHLVSEKPLAFSTAVLAGETKSGDACKAFSRIKALPHPDDFDKVTRLEVTLEDTGFHLTLATLGGVRFKLPLNGKEPLDAFLA